MGLTFRKSIKIANGVKLNVSKTGVSVTVGKKGAHYTFNSKGKSTVSAGIPGTGVGYRKSFNTFGGLFGGKKEKEEVTKKSGSSLTKNTSKKTNKATYSSQQLDEYNEYIRQIKSLHVKSINPIDWKSLALGCIPNNLSEKERANWQADINLAKSIMHKDSDTYLEVIQEYSTLNDISAYGSDFEFGVDEKDILSCRFEVKIKDVVPTFGYKQNEDGSIVDCNLRKTEFNDLAQDYVCSCSIRIAREVFALLPVDFVLVSAEEEFFDSSTGNNQQVTILSILFIRDGFENINFERIDPSDFCARFKQNMSFTKTNGFKPVDEIDLNDIK